MVDDPQQFLLLPLWYAVFLLSLTCHEAAHALAARLGGDDTAYLGGQATLNPLPHVRREPMGALAIPLISFLLFGGGWMLGWGSAPYDPFWEDRHPRRAALMALAGPLANLALFALAFVALRSGIALGVWSHPLDGWAIDRLVAPAGGGPGLAEAIGRLASLAMFLNLVLFVFNLMPVPPLDGASVLGGFVPSARAMRDWLRSSPIGGLAGLALAWALFPRIFPPVLAVVFKALYAG